MSDINPKFSYAALKAQAEAARRERQEQITESADLIDLDVDGNVVPLSDTDR